MQTITAKKRADRPSRVLQFGEGNFLRAFVDYIIDCSNEAGAFDSNITIVKPIDFGDFERFNKQNNMYTVILRGVKNGQVSVENHIVASVSETVDPFTQIDKYRSLMKNEDFRFIVSNTTEAGIVFSADDRFDYDIPKTFPGKITKLLHQRFMLFNGDITKGFIFLPVELIEKNGDKLKQCVLQYIDLWKLGNKFLSWVEQANIFCNTLVDRIVSGYPKSEEEALWKAFGYQDELMVTGEPFGFWAIGSERIEQVEKELTLKSGVQVIFAKDIEPYKQRKVRILNGAHTSLVMGAYLYGCDIVEQCMADATLKSYMLSCIFDEIIPTIDLDKAELEDFANSVVERFENPFLNHKLLDICLNSTSKWRARVMPSLLDYIETNKTLPKNLTLSFAMYIAFYKGIQKNDDGCFGMRDGEPYRIMDDEYAMNVFLQNSDEDTGALLKTVMQDQRLWGEDLTEIEGFYDAVLLLVKAIEAKGIKAVLTEHIKE